MPRTDKDFEHKKQQLIEYAYELFLEKTYEKTSTGDVMARANITQAAFYHYFASKDDLLDEVINVFHCRIASHFLWIDDPDICAESKLIKLLEEGITYINSPDLYVMNLHFEQNSDSVFYSRTLHSLHSFVRELLEKTITQGISEGTFTTGTPQFDARLIETVFSTFYQYLSCSSVEDLADKALKTVQGCLNLSPAFSIMLKEGIRTAFFHARDIGLAYSS